ncbi:MFS transporter [Streptococcus dysgalactiae]|uniref:MFS transporter n=1 Tax=Streptococcus dysgalactiae TaxID=1334 RepID=UPI002DD41E1E|nr:MFS transporter [Streptococcus dysgalactiae]MEC4578562.1 MFS transporter [Streptococcus dysgalactiae]
MESLLIDKNKYLMSVIFDNFGSSLMTFAIPVYILGLSDSVLYLSLISSLTILPFLVLGMPFGALVDKLDIKKLLYLSDFIRFFLYLTSFFIVAYIDSIGIKLWTIIIVTILVSCINVISSISETTYLPYLLKHTDDFTSLNSSIYSIQYILGILSPIVGGMIYSKYSIGILLLISSLCYLLSSFSFYYIKVVENKSNLQFSFEIFKDIVADIVKGYVYVSSRKTVFLPLVITAVFNILTANFQNDSLIFLKNIVNLNTSQIGFVASVTTCGALSGAFLINFLSKKFEFHKLFIANILLQSILRIIYPQWTNVYVIVAITFVIDALQSILNIIIITNRQELVAQEYLGRANSLYKTVLIGVNSIGFITGGFITKNLGVRLSLLISGISLVILYCIASLLYRTISKKD